MKEVFIAEMSATSFRMDLISAVEEQRVIWDVTHDHYRVVERKNSAWRIVSQEIEAKGHQCDGKYFHNCG